MGRAAARPWLGLRSVLTQDLTYEQIYRYRIVVEPAAILEPDTFLLDRPAIEAGRAGRWRYSDGRGLGLSPVEVFEIGSKFHRIVLSCSRNPFFISGFDHANRMRRLVEYKKTLSSPHWLDRCGEYARIAELLLLGEQGGASPN